MAVEALRGVAVAPAAVVVGAIGRAVVPGRVLVANVVKVVHLGLVLEQASSDGVHGRVAPPLVEEAALLVEIVKEVEVGL